MSIPILRRTARWAVLLGLASWGCDGGSGGTVDAPPLDAALDGGSFVPATAFAPPTIRFRPGSTSAAFAPCELAGAPVGYGERVLVDDCVECQCTTWGLRCRRRASCPDDRCVFVDGQTAPRGGAAVVESCFDCACGDDGARCRRRTEAPCPSDGCRLGDAVLALGEQRFVSECHACTCDAEAGLTCADLCHPSCYCADDNPLCAPVCAGVACPVEIPDQDRVELACGAPVCDYGGLVGAPGCGL